MNVRKPHPSDHPLLFLFVVGGVTSAEVKKIKEVLTSQNIKTKVRTQNSRKTYDCVIHVDQRVSKSRSSIKQINV